MLRPDRNMTIPEHRSETRWSEQKLPPSPIKETTPAPIPSHESSTKVGWLGKKLHPSNHLTEYT